jgi:hypothetical protein
VAYQNLVDKEKKLLRNGFDITKKITKLTGKDVYIDIFYNESEKKLNREILNVDSFKLLIDDYKINKKDFLVI